MEVGIVYEFKHYHHKGISNINSDFIYFVTFSSKSKIGRMVYGVNFVEIGWVESKEPKGSMEWKQWETDRRGIVVHEILHAFGFIHEHSRKKASDFLTFDEKNIKYDGKFF